MQVVDQLWKARHENSILKVQLDTTQCVNNLKYMSSVALNANLFACRKNYQYLCQFNVNSAVASSSSHVAAVKTESHVSMIPPLPNPHAAITSSTGTFLDRPAKLLPDLDRKLYPSVQYWNLKSWLRALKNGTVTVSKPNNGFESGSDSDSDINSEEANATANAFLETQDGLYIGESRRGEIF